MFWVIWEPQMLILTLKSEFIRKIYNLKKKKKKKDIWEKNPRIVNTGQLPINDSQ